MKKTISVFIFALVGITLLANINSINLSSSSTELELLRSNDNGLQMKLNMEEITSFEVITEEGAFSQVSIEGFTHSNVIGTPKLPIIRKIISVPYGAEISAKALSYETMKYQLQDFGISNPLMPAQLPVPKSADPSETVFSYDPKAYSKNQFTPNELISVEELGIMRGVRLFVVEVSPIQYNPVEGSLLVLNNIEIKVDFIGGDHAQTQWERSRTYSPYFEATFAHSIINYTHIRSRDQITQYPIKYVIISDPMFQTQLQPFIEWKTEKGFEVIEAYTDEPNVGNTTTSIKSFLQDLYDAGTPEDPAPSFVLFVGDVAQIPAWNGTAYPSGHITDLSYARLDGTDYVADMYYGRFSANNTTELQPQIDKTLEYEKYEMPDPNYLEEVVMIAGMDSSHGSTWGNGQINYGTTYYFNAAHGILSHTYLYPNSGSNSANIIQNVSDGIGYINYTAHGSSTSWSNPSFTISNINGLQNEHKYGLAVGNCCLTNKFEVYTCFGEAWLRAENKGAIGYIGGTNSTYWDEDYWWGVGAGTITSNPTYETTGQGVYDGLFHDHGEDFTDWYTTTAGIIFNGNLAVTEGGGMINYYWEIYSIMGDPSLTLYLGVPQENIATYPDVIFLGLDNIQITAEPYSYVSLTMDGVIHGNGLIDESGVISLDFDAFTIPGMAKLVITRQNCEPLIDEIEVIPSDGPYVIFESYIIYDTATGNGNGSLENGEIVDIDMSVENLGTGQATNAIATISSTDPYITIIDNTENFGNIAAGDISLIASAFTIEAAEDIPDSHMINFELEVVAEDTWISYFSIEAYAPTFPPENLTAEIQNFNDVILTWEQPSGTDNTRDLTGYKIYKNGLMIVEITDLAILTYTDFTLAPGDYEYHITALFHAGESGPSNIELVTIFLPAPQNPEAVTQYANILVTWDEPASRAFSHYKVYRDMIMIADDILETSYLDPAVPNGTYCYNIRAVYSGDYQSALSTDAVIEHVQSNVNDVIIPVTTELTGNYPNPFNPTTKVNFSLKADSKVSLSIYNIRGQRVKILIAGNIVAGYHSIVWNGRDDNGKNVSSGIYFSRFDAADDGGDYTSVKKMILLK